MNRYFGYQDKILLLQHGSTELLALAQRRGAQLHKLLSGTTIFEQDLHKPHGRLHHADWLKLLQNCQQQVNSPELPFLLGSAMLNSRYISLCQSLQYAANLRQALCQLYYFRHQLLPGIYASVHKYGDTIAIEFKAAVGLKQQQAFIIELVYSLLLALIKQQLHSSTGISAELQCPAPLLPQQYQLHWGCNISFGQPHNRLLIPVNLWQQHFITNDAAKFRAARCTCLQLNRLLPKQPGLLEAITRRQRRALPQLLTLEQVAVFLGLSSSALKRLLSQHKTSFAQLIDEVRSGEAINLLQQGDYSNRQLAQRLGYSDEHNFRRAFKRWTGLIPSACKELLKV
ncbi:AraC family transcriptional regulator ligand-binding domain-containing protein [Chromatiaceae bacterium AAb-1]|nr:AraC family transcriptional regulator ligand-binding domain-containing protein [Chromatiaceae bacterium AAb-1]